MRPYQSRQDSVNKCTNDIAVEKSIKFNLMTHVGRVRIEATLVKTM